MFDSMLHRFSVIPVRNKIPLVKWGDYIHRKATEQEISSWKQSFGEHEIGVVTGPISGIFVLDIDGESGLKEAKRRGLPRTAFVKTKKGYHYYFRWTSELDNKVTTKVRIGEEMDIRGHSGYVVFYGWVLPPNVAPLAFPPQWLVDLLPNKEARIITGSVSTKPEDWMIHELDNVDPKDPVNGRTPTFVRAIGRLKAKGLSESEVKSLLSPWATKYEYPKLDNLVDNQFRRYPPRPDAVVITASQQAENAEAFCQDETPVNWICDPFITDQTIGFIAGLPESRKSWILMDLAIEIARGGGMWLNKFPVKGGKVLLIDQERSKSEAQRRIRAMLAAKTLNAKNVKDSLFIRSGTSTRLDLQPSYDSLRKELSDIRPNILLVDSFATFHTKNESNRMEIQQVLERIKEIRNDFKCAVVFIHHETKGSYQAHKEGSESSYLDMAGNVAIPAAAEFCMNVRKHDDQSSFCHHTKSTQGPKMAPFMVKVRDVVPDRSQISVEAY